MAQFGFWWLSLLWAQGFTALAAILVSLESFTPEYVACSLRGCNNAVGLPLRKQLLEVHISSWTIEDFFSKWILKSWIAESKMVLSRAVVVQKRWSCEVLGSHQFSQGDPGLCWGRSCFNIVDLTFRGQWHSFPVRYQKPYSGSFARLPNHPSLAIRKGSAVEVVVARCHYCSSK